MSGQQTVFHQDGEGGLKLLILAGGLSSRMGAPKHLLHLPQCPPLYIQILQRVMSAYPDLRTCYISLRKDSVESSSIISGIRSHNVDAYILHDDDIGDEKLTHVYPSSSLGPAAGMRMAHELEPNSSFLVVACDFPLLTAETISFLLDRYQSPVTCYRNAEGYCEPLLGIWSSIALNRLCKNMQEGSLGPRQVVKQLNGHTIFPPISCEQWLFNTNTKAEWRQALDMLRRQ